MDRVRALIAELTTVRAQRQTVDRQRRDLDHQAEALAGLEDSAVRHLADEVQRLDYQRAARQIAAAPPPPPAPPPAPVLPAPLPPASLSVTGATLAEIDQLIARMGGPRAAAAEPGPAVPKVLSPVRFTDDFRTVDWYGVHLANSGSQAAVFRQLYLCGKRGLYDVSADELLEQAGGACKELRSLFKRGGITHAAWGKVIVPSPGRPGMYRLRVPDGKPPPADWPQPAPLNGQAAAAK